jgi:RNA polymerase sigma-70 factor (ECF subfamily)
MLGYAVADAADILGVSQGTVKSRCARGRARLLPRLAHLRQRSAPRRGASSASTDHVPEPAPGNRSAAGDVLPAREGGDDPS